MTTGTQLGLTISATKLCGIGVVPAPPRRVLKRLVGNHKVIVVVAVATGLPFEPHEAAVHRADRVLRRQARGVVRRRRKLGPRQVDQIVERRAQRVFCHRVRLSRCQ